ncbi:hypothetical protein BpHYR1_003745 [Brachionus plicatilis]|uniref:Uncharacterized protein n=1 Tax=Brachionus plicatilis TaxID=10195 RepID=A0A3M7QTW4_BRAPC|nr:hypothetical protein BpHYR1_003745 [Brachionus plicatilis]
MQGQYYKRIRKKSKCQIGTDFLSDALKVNVYESVNQDTHLDKTLENLKFGVKIISVGIRCGPSGE